MVVHCGHARLVWNVALEQMGAARSMGRHCDWRAWDRQLAELRNEPGFEWLAEGSSSVQQQALRQLRKAWTDFFKNPSHFARPRFRAKHRTRPGFAIRDVRTDKLNKKWSQVHVPKVGWVKFRTDRRQLNDHGMAHVTREADGRWFVSFSASQPPVKAKEGRDERAVGVDRGVNTTVATSDRETSNIPLADKTEEKHLRKLEERLLREQDMIERLQWKMAQQTLGSNRRETTRKQIAKLVGRQRRRRKDWVEKISTRLVSVYGLSAFENLNTVGMMKSASGTLEAPGVNVAAKTGLNRGIAASCWGMLLRRVRDKAEASGAIVVEVPAAAIPAQRTGPTSAHSDACPADTPTTPTSTQQTTYWRPGWPQLDAERNTQHQLLFLMERQLHRKGAQHEHSRRTPNRETRSFRNGRGHGTESTEACRLCLASCCRTVCCRQACIASTHGGHHPAVNRRPKLGPLLYLTDCPSVEDGRCCDAAEHAPLAQVSRLPVLAAPVDRYEAVSLACHPSVWSCQPPRCP